ncbi:hypothetical protein B0H10DRAFT_2231484 [Mycena sp. CBHHK59/15]|nr:hypothetical protein B0H10DRAFT_2231484 [Mycena sp. CBHHK59/15]
MPKDQSKHAKKRTSGAPPTFNFRFGNVSIDEAAQGLKRVSECQNTTIPSRSLASDIQLKELWLTTEQKDAIAALNATDACLDAKFYVNGDQEQQSQYKAAVLMASHGLDLDSREDNGNRWRVGRNLKSVKHRENDPPSMTAAPPLNAKGTEQVETQRLEENMCK